MENRMVFSQKIKIRTILWFSSSTFGYFPKEMKTQTQKYICILMFTAALLMIAYIYIHICIMFNEIYFFCHKKGLLPSVTIKTQLEGPLSTETSQTEEDRYWVISLIGGIYKLKTKFIENRPVVVRGVGGEWVTWVR